LPEEKERAIIAKTAGPGTMAKMNIAQNKVNILSIDKELPFKARFNYMFVEITFAFLFE
jgi:hypothetical protein